MCPAAGRRGRKRSFPSAKRTRRIDMNSFRFTCLAALLLLFPQVGAAVDVGVHAQNYDGPAWSPYLVGAGIGVLSWLTFYFADKPIGASSFYATVAGFLGKLFARRHTESLKYYQSNPPRVGWGFVFVTCTILGGFIAAW